MFAETDWTEHLLEIGLNGAFFVLAAVAVRTLSRWLRGPRVPWRHAFAAAAVMTIVNALLDRLAWPTERLWLSVLAMTLYLLIGAALGGAYLARALRAAPTGATWGWGARLAGAAAVTSYVGLLAAALIMLWIAPEPPAAMRGVTAFAPPTGETVMDEARFWSLVDAAKVQAGGDLDVRVGALQDQLAELEPAALQAFQNHYDEMLRRSYRWDLWGAAYLINGGASDDGFHYFRDWLISEGRAVFEAALADPDSLAALPRVEFAELESFGYVALHLYEQRTGAELDRGRALELEQPAGAQWREEDLPARFPRLAAKYAPGS